MELAFRSFAKHPAYVPMPIVTLALGAPRRGSAHRKPQYTLAGLRAYDTARAAPPPGARPPATSPMDTPREDQSPEPPAYIATIPIAAAPAARPRCL